LAGRYYLFHLWPFTLGELFQTGRAMVDFKESPLDIITDKSTEAEKALKKKYFHPFDLTGKPMKGWVMVDKAGFQKDAELKKLLNLAKRFVKTLPSK